MVSQLPPQENKTGIEKIHSTDTINTNDLFRWFDESGIPNTKNTTEENATSRRIKSAQHRTLLSWSDNLVKKHLDESMSLLSVAEHHLQKAYSKAIVLSSSNKLLTAEASLNNAMELVLTEGDRRNVSQMANRLLTICQEQEIVLEKYEKFL